MSTTSLDLGGSTTFDACPVGRPQDGDGAPRRRHDHEDSLPSKVKEAYPEHGGSEGELRRLNAAKEATRRLGSIVYPGRCSVDYFAIHEEFKTDRYPVTVFK